MAGHSKWKNIQHRKGAKDAQRGQIFTRLIREITLAARGGADPALNSRLRAAMDKALSNNMSKETMQKAINKGAGLDGGSNLSEVLYEGYGPGGVAFLVFCATDNTNRTVSEIRHLFTKSGGALGSPGSVSYLFEERGVLRLDPAGRVEELLELLLSLDGVIDALEEEDPCEIIVLCEPSALHAISQAAQAADFTVLEQERQHHPLTQVPYDEALALQIQKLYDKLDEHDDLQHLACNFCFEPQGES